MVTLDCHHTFRATTRFARETKINHLKKSASSDKHIKRVHSHLTLTKSSKHSSMASQMSKVQLSSAMISALSKAEVSGLEIVDPDQSGSFSCKPVCDSCSRPAAVRVVELVELALAYASTPHCCH